MLKSPNVFHFTNPTVVQSTSIPLICKGGDVMIKSETGSGKTLSYLIPIVQRLQSITPQIQRSDGAYALILVPTRELCVQIEETIKKASPLITEVKLFDIYRGANLGEGKKSMAFSLTLSDPAAEVSAEQVERTVKKVLGNLKFKLGIEIR